MFRSASTRQSDLASHRFASHMDYWTRTASTWFDGTTASVDERIAQLDNVLRFARDTASRLGSTEAGRYCGVVLPQLEHSRRELAAVRDSLLNGFSDRQAGARALADRRTASVHYADPNPIAPGTAAPASGVALTPGAAGPPTGTSTTPALTPGAAGSLSNEPGFSSTGQSQADVAAGRGVGSIASLQRAVELGSRDFLANQNTDDREELLIRARRYAADETSTMPTSVATRVAAAFVGRVEELIARRPRKRTAAQPITHYEDFDDQLLY